MGWRAARRFRGKSRTRDEARTDPTGAHPEHEIQLLLPGRAVAERRQHATEVHEVQVLEHLHDARGERRDGQLGDAHQLILAEVTLVSLVQRSEALVQRLDLAMVEPPAALLLHLLHVVLRQVQTRRRQAHRHTPRGSRATAPEFMAMRRTTTKSRALRARARASANFAWCTNLIQVSFRVNLAAPSTNTAPPP